MTTKIISVFMGLCAMFTQHLAAQHLIPYKETKGKGTLWGLKSQDGVIVQKAQFDQIEILNDSLFKTFKNEKQGLFHEKIGEVYAPEFDYIKPYAKSILFRLKKTDAMGVGDYKGKMILPVSKKLVIQRSERVAFNGDSIDTFCYYTEGKENSYGLFRSDGKSLLPPEQKIVYHFSDGLALFRDKDEQYKFLNIEGEVEIEAKYEEVKSFKQGLAAVRCFARDNGGYASWGFINKKQELVIPCQLGGFDLFYEDSVTYLIKISGYQYATIYDVHQRKYLPNTFSYIGWVKGKLAPAKKMGSYGIINVKGEIIVPFIYSDITESGNGWKVTKNHIVMELDTNGREYLDTDAILTRFEATPNGDRYGFNNKAGNTVIEPALYKTYGGDLSARGFQIYEDIGESNYYFIGSKLYAVVEDYYLPSVTVVRDSMRFLPVFTDGKWRQFNIKELRILPDQEYDDVKLSARIARADYPFNSGLLAVKKNDLWGYINYSGHQVIGFKYHSCLNFSGGRAAVSYDGVKWGFIDEKGTEVIPCQYTFLTIFEKDRPKAELVMNDTVYEISKDNIVLSQKKYIKPTQYTTNNNYTKSEKTCSLCAGAGMICEGGTKCEYCNGTGNPDYQVRCNGCGGDGWEKVQENTTYRNSSTLQYYGTTSTMKRTGRTCGICHGNGNIYYSYCNKCRGTGKSCNDRQRCSKCDGAGTVYE